MSKMLAFSLVLPSLLAGQSNTHEIAPAPGGRFALEVFKSKLWEGRKHTFVFDRYRGVLSVDHEHPERSTVQFVVESASAKCTDDWVKPQQIKDIERAALDTMAALMFPELSFRSSRIIVKSSDQYDVEGLLTIRDRTKQVAISLRGAPREGEFWVEGSGRVKLSDFGLKPPKAVFGVGIFIGTQDLMNVVFRLLAK